MVGGLAAKLFVKIDSVVGVFIKVTFLGTAYLLIFVNLVKMT